MLVMSSITFSVVHLYLLKEMSTYLVIIQIEQVHFLFSIYSLPQKNNFCVNCVNIYKLLLRGSIFRVNIYCILSYYVKNHYRINFVYIFSILHSVRIKLSCLVLSCLVLSLGAGRSSEVERSLMVRWVVGSILHGVDPLSYFSFQPVLHDCCNKGRGMCYPVCGMVHIKEPLLLIDKSSLCGGSGFPFSLSEWSLTICLTPYNRR